MTLGSGSQTETQSQTHHHFAKPRSMYCILNGNYWVLPLLLDLPDDALFIILSYCDLQSLGRLSQVCRRLAHLVSQDCVWITLSKRLTIIKSKEGWWRNRGSQRKVRLKEQCRYANNWMIGHFQDLRLVHHGVRQLPWLQADRSSIWVSYKNIIHCYQQRMDGTLRELPKKMLRGHRDDIGRFVVKDNMIVTGSRDRSIHAYSSMSGECLVQLRNCHVGDIQAVDSYRDIAISGSRDATIKIWSLLEMSTSKAHQKTLEVNDRVWSLALNPNGRTFASGTAGINHVAPLRIWDTESGQLMAVLGSQYKYGAGVLDIQYETPEILLSCGYDTNARMWDLRKSHAHCVMQWEDPFDSVVYCVQSDGHYSIITGTARHGLVRLWDKRHIQPVQMYYSGRSSSPVYSMAFDSGHLYVALDKGINMLDFTIPG